MKTLRLFCSEDCHLLLTWRNHPETRRWSFSSKIIEPEEHDAWFRGFLADPHKVGLTMIEDGLPVAQIRFEPAQHPGTRTISISVSPEHFGKGYGHEILAMALRHPEVTRQAAVVRAETFTDNVPSIKLFEHSGFKLLGRGKRDGHEFVEWRLPIAPELTSYPIGLEGEGPLLDSARETLDTFGIVPKFIFRSESYSRDSCGNSVQGASSPLSVLLQDQVLATGARALLIFDWPERIPLEFLSHFKGGLFVFRRSGSGRESYLELQPGLFEFFGVTTATCGGLILDVLARLAFQRKE